MAEFDPQRVELRGRHMIEANAGTGKTYNIAALYLRLLLETELEVDQILVMTYTRAATAELRQRIELWLRDAVLGLAGRLQYRERLVGELVAAVVADQRDSKRRKLQRSLHNLDIAAIHTIHGFCKRALDAHGFACGVEPDFEFIGDETMLIDTVFHQVWRRRSASLTPRLAAELLADKGFVDSTLQMIKVALQHPGCQILAADADTQAVASALSEVNTQAAGIAANWRDERTALLPVLTDTTNFKGNAVWAKRANKLIELLDQFGPETWPALSRHRDFKQLSARAIRSATPKTVNLSHLIFDRFELFTEQVTQLRLLQQAQKQQLQLELLELVRDGLRVWKQQHRQRSYSDLVSELHRGLSDSTVLRRNLRQQYKAALIDEFQDTDPLQFDILQQLFPGVGELGFRVGSSSDPASDCQSEADAPVFFVGDPKQAMYNFRGADVFAYLQARQSVEQIHQLSRNWRSTAALIDSVNDLFAVRADPFVLPEIQYQPSSPGDRPVVECSGGSNNTSLHGWLLPAADDGRRMSKVALTAIAVDRTAREIAQLLSAGATIGGSPVEPGDIAVLVRKHEQGTAIAAGLRRLGLASVQVGRTRIFQQPEAGELEAVLRAVMSPQAGAVVRAALATRLLGWSLSAVADLLTDDDGLETQIQVFEQLHTSWREQGLATVVLELLARFDIPQRLLVREGGERTLATVFQLLDLLYEQTELVNDPARLIRWLRAKRSSSEFDEQELLHLDTDAALVRIVTIHAAKGMEYPIVFCPFMWDHGSQRGPVSFHDQNVAGRFTIDLGSSELPDHQRQADTESLAEELRVCYVALTRAMQRCYFCWGVAAGGEFAALRYLLHGQGEPGFDGGADSFADNRIRLDPAINQRKIEAAEATLQELGVATERLVLAVEPIVPTVSPQRGLVALQPPPIPVSAQRITSFSALVSHEEEFEQAARPPAEVLPSSNTIGLMLHEILESLANFQPTTDQLHQSVVDQMAKYGIDCHWTEQVIEQVTQCLEAPLDAQSGLRLADLPAAQTLPEMNFDLSLISDRRNDRLRRLEGYLMAEHGIRAGAGADYLTGAIDLVFVWQDRYYIVDYKTNYLGQSVDAYDRDGIRRSIARARYDLQYLLYTTALHRYLNLRLDQYDYQRHFGGVFYLYLRGMRADSAVNTGVYFACPQLETIAAIDEILGGKVA